MKKLFTLLAFIMLSIITWGQNVVLDTTYYDNGNIREIRSYHATENVLHGTCVLYFENGDTSAIAGYEMGKKHGLWKVWHPTGAVAYELHYIRGEKTGTWYAYNDKGELQTKRKY